MQVRHHLRNFSVFNFFTKIHHIFINSYMINQSVPSSTASRRSWIYHHFYCDSQLPSNILHHYDVGYTFIFTVTHSRDPERVCIYEVGYTFIFTVTHSHLLVQVAEVTLDIPSFLL